MAADKGNDGTPVPADAGTGASATTPSAKKQRRSRAQLDHRRDPWRSLYDAYDAVDREPTAWRFEPLDVENIQPPPQATICRRDDQQGLLFPGMAHSFFGDADSMKTWLAMFAVREAMASEDVHGRPDQSVMYLDCERNRETFVRRMASIGTDLEALRANCAYFRVVVPLLGPNNKPTDGYRDLDIALDYFNPSILVIDGVTEFMAIHGWDVNDPTDVARYHALLLRRWPGARTTVEIDHTAKNSFGPRTQFGSQHKRAGIDGASYEVEKKMDAGQGGVSASRVLLRKDNEGGIREHCDVTGVAAWLRLDSTDDGAWRLDLLAPDAWAVAGLQAKAEAKDAKDDEVADRLIALLPAWNKQLMSGLKIGAVRLERILDRLEADGRIERDPAVTKNPRWNLVESR
ncbi:MAG: AAA family ATPase [Anaerolineaceae bacterium]